MPLNLSSDVDIAQLEVKDALRNAKNLEQLQAAWEAAKALANQIGHNGNSTAVKLFNDECTALFGLNLANQYLESAENKKMLREAYRAYRNAKEHINELKSSNKSAYDNLMVVAEIFSEQYKDKREAVAKESPDVPRDLKKAARGIVDVDRAIHISNIKADLKNLLKELEKMDAKSPKEKIRFLDKNNDRIEKLFANLQEANGQAAANILQRQLQAILYDPIDRHIQKHVKNAEKLLEKLNKAFDQSPVDQAQVNKISKEMAHVLKSLEGTQIGNEYTRRFKETLDHPSAILDQVINAVKKMDDKVTGLLNSKVGETLNERDIKSLREIQTTLSNDFNTYVMNKDNCTPGLLKEFLQKLERIERAAEPLFRRLDAKIEAERVDIHRLADEIYQNIASADKQTPVLRENKWQGHNNPARESRMASNTEIENARRGIVENNKELTNSEPSPRVTPLKRS